MSRRRHARSERRAQQPVPAPRRSNRLPILLGALVVAVAAGALALIFWPTVAAPARLQGPLGGIQCAGFPLFAVREGFEPGRAAIGTRETVEIGLVIVDAQAQRTYRHETWDDAGTLGAFALDEVGTIYVAPAPRTSLYTNPLENQNTIYRVDTQTGVMEPFVRLPAAQEPRADVNPYGVLGLAIDCETSSLYATSVAGSTRTEEVGRIFRIDLTNGTITSQIDGVDGFGVGVFQATEGRRLYVGLARRPEVLAIELDANGDLIPPPRTAFSIAGEVIDGTGRVRRITWSADGTMVLAVTGFTYTLDVPADSQQLLRSYDSRTDTWEPVELPGG